MIMNGGKKGKSNGIDLSIDYFNRNKISSESSRVNQH